MRLDLFVVLQYELKICGAWPPPRAASICDCASSGVHEGEPGLFNGVLGGAGRSPTEAEAKCYNITVQNLTLKVQSHVWVLTFKTDRFLCRHESVRGRLAQN